MADDFDTLVVTVTRNKRAVAEQTIAKLKSLTNRPFHYAVVANGDLDSGEWLLANRKAGWFDSLAVVSDNLGVGPGYNLFWRHFHRFNKNLRYVVKFDDSNVPTRRDWLDQLIALGDYFEGRAGMIGFLIEGNDHPWPLQDWEGWNVRPTPHNCSSSCCLLTRSVWEQVGFWDEEILGWIGEKKDQGPIYYNREDGLMGMLTRLAGLKNLYHEDLDAIHCVGEKDERPDYVKWKRDQYGTALPHQLRVFREYSQRKRTFPHAPPI